MPGANQTSSSQIQKSLSVCDAIMCLSVMTRSSTTLYAVDLVSRYCVISFSNAWSSAKLMSLNVGAAIVLKFVSAKIVSASGDGATSKSVGSGMSVISGGCV